jgi:hypothetical protein
MTVACNDASRLGTGSVRISGTSTGSRSISIEGGRHDIFLDGITMRTGGNLAVSASDVQFHLSGINVIDSSTTVSQAGISCATMSNVTFQGADGAISVIGGGNAPAIGPEASQSCGSLTFIK